MTIDDEMILLNLIRNYSVQDMLETLDKLYQREADEAADMGLKEKARSYADAACMFDRTNAIL
jgi:uncharacterized membrane protein